MATFWLAAIILIPIIAIIFLRVNALLVFLALCLGYTLTQFDGNNSTVIKAVNTYKLTKHLVGSSNVHLILLLLPPVIVLLAMIKTSSKNKWKLSLLPAIAVGLLAGLTVTPFLPTATAVNILSTPLWRQLANHEELIVGLSTIVVVAMLILERSKFSPSAKSSKHKKSKD